MLAVGLPFRSDAAAITCRALLGCPVRSVELVDERLYHVDLTFCPLDDRRAICAPLGWDRYGRKVVEALVPEPLWLEDDEALASAPTRWWSAAPSSCHVPPRSGRQLEAWGFTVVESRSTSSSRPAAAAAASRWPST